ncbi:MAG: anthranilate phosphoribosyltransferase [Candidatus Aureabacteria bacterium]|nr:anthranilate phosphoribosyltransferase [Candidatus Auribacterota bacterium]
MERVQQMDYRAFVENDLPQLFPPPPAGEWTELLAVGRRILAGDPLTPRDAGRAMELMIGGPSRPYETALFLSAAQPGSCTPEALAAMAGVMRSRSIRITFEPDSRILADNCGTGGDALHLFNISTSAMFIMAAAGMPIAKHGNRASTSRAGSADVLESLGVRIDLAADAVARCIRRTGIGFMFAPRYHPAMRNVAAVRHALPFCTVFNLLGPLCNPAPVSAQLVGVYHPDMLEPVARALSLLGLPRALVVCGEAGAPHLWMDEVSTVGTTHALRVTHGCVTRLTTDPAALDLKKPSLDELRGGSPAENAAILTSILKGSDRGPRRDICLANAAAGLYAAGLVDTMPDGMDRARAALESGGALQKLGELAKESNR